MGAAFDTLQDTAWDMGAPLQWGRLPGTHKHWVRILTPEGPIERHGDTRDHAAQAILDRNLTTHGTDHQPATA